MKLNGIEEANHKIFGEIERNRNFIKKIKEAEETVDSNAIESLPEKKLKLDTAAAMRMVKPFINPSKIEAENLENSKVKETKVGETRKLNKGSILPKRDHLNWKEQLEKMQE